MRSPSRTSRSRPPARSCPDTGAGLRYADECSSSPVKPSAPGHSGMRACVLVSVGDHDLARIDVAGRGFQSPTGRLPVDAGDFGSPAAARSRFHGRGGRGGRRRRRGSGTSASPSGTAGSADARTACRCSASAGRSGLATTTPRGRPGRSTVADSPRSRRLSATETPAGPAPITAMSVISCPNDRRRATVQRARGCAPAQTSRSACTVTMV